MAAPKEDLQITEDDPETMDEMWERLRIESLPEKQQAMNIEHKLNELDAIPPIYARQ